MELLLDEYVQVNVGGLPYSIAVSDIEKFPASFLQCVIKKKLSKLNDEPIIIHRDGKIFRFVYSFLVTGHLPRDMFGELAVNDETLEALKAEADFYGLAELAAECNIQLKTSNIFSMDSYLSIKDYATTYRSHPPVADYEFAGEFRSDLFSALKGIWSPFCITGKLSPTVYRQRFPDNNQIYKSSTVYELNVQELIADATVSGVELQTEPRNTLQIDANCLNLYTRIFIALDLNIEKLAPHMKVSTRANKLVIHQEGFSQDWSPVLPPNSSKEHIGTLVVILNSEYTGGELEVTHGGRTEVVTGPYKWVAMYGDCLHKINPVTSGTRVSLIYDIFGNVPPKKKVSIWNTIGEHANPLLVARNRSIGAETRRYLHHSLSQELTTFNTVLITLQQLYPERENMNNSILQGGDRALYEVFTTDNNSPNATAETTLGTDHNSSSVTFEVQIFNATVCYEYDALHLGRESLSIAPYSTAIVNKALMARRAAFACEGENGQHNNEENAKEANLAHLGKYKVYIPVSMHMLTHTVMREAEDLGEPTAGQAVYLVSCLQVRLKA